MIEKIFTSKPYPIYSTGTSLYKFIATLLIVKKMNKIAIGKIQVYLWGLESEANREQILRWKKTKQVTSVPLLVENDLMSIISQCISNGFIKTEVDKSKKTFFTLDFRANNFLNHISNLELTSELNSHLDEMGKITDTLLNNLEFDF